MGFLSILWDDKDDPDGNVEHISLHGLTPDDVEHVLLNPASGGRSRSSGLPVLWGYTPDDRYVIVVYEALDASVIRVITAYEVPEPEE